MKTVGDLRSECVRIMRLVMAGEIDDRKARTMLHAASVTAELFRAEAESQRISMDLHHPVPKTGNTPLAGS